MKRALRRHHKERMKRKADRIFNTINYSGFIGEMDKEMLSRLADNLKPCSCYVCGNPRKWWGEVTFQELKEEERWRQQLDYLY